MSNASHTLSIFLRQAGGSAVRCAKITGVLACAVAFSLAVGGDLPHSQTYRGLMGPFGVGIGTPPADTAPGVWQPLGNYVSENGLTDAMVASERLRHEAEQRALLAPKETVPVNIRIPLLPGPVQKAVAPPAPVVVPPVAGGVANSPAVDRADNKARPAAAAPANRLAEDTLTLEAFKRALKELGGDEKSTATGPYNDGVADR
jgi:hypothetical protein